MSASLASAPNMAALMGAFCVTALISISGYSNAQRSGRTDPTSASSTGVYAAEPRVETLAAKWPPAEKPIAQVTLEVEDKSAPRYREWSKTVDDTELVENVERSGPHGQGLRILSGARLAVDKYRLHAVAVQSQGQRHPGRAAAND
jgi:hypothetical protein